MMTARQVITISWVLFSIFLTNISFADDPNTNLFRFQLEEWRETGAKTLSEKTILESDESVFSCDFGELSGYRCNRGFGDAINYVPPYPTTLPHLTPDLPGSQVDRELVPMNLVHNGLSLLKEWKELADSGMPFDCRDMQCYIIVEASGESRTVNETWYAVCKVAKLNKSFGAPQNCLQIAVETENETWIIAVVGSYSASFIVGRPDFTFRIYGTPPEYRLPDTDTVISKIAKAFNVAPLELETQIESSDAVLGIASYRPSPILVGWREIVTIRVDLDLENWLEPNFLGLVVSTTFYVNRQNTTSPEDWSLPTEQQASTYLSTIKSQVKVALSTLCTSVEFRPQDYVSCQL